MAINSMCFSYIIIEPKQAFRDTSHILDLHLIFYSDIKFVRFRIHIIFKSPDVNIHIKTDNHVVAFPNKSCTHTNDSLSFHT